ncbi:ABC transporter permease, partial [Lactococcus lactis]|nr:ABC transporter permease [Lactococcus lactis]
CGLKRFSIFIVNLSAIAISSLLSSIIALLLSKISIDKFNLTIFLISKDAYHSDNFLLSLLLVFILLFFFSSLGLVLGTFNDIFSGFKKIIILLLVMSIPIVLSILIQLGNSAMKNKWFNFLKSIIGYSREKG